MIKKFKLGGVSWSVKIDNDRMDIESCLGITIYSESSIYLSDKYQGKKVGQGSLEQTLYHEVVHAILDTLGYRELSSDEKLVQGLSVLLHQFETTKT